MKTISTYDIVEMVVDEATDQSNGLWIISESNKDKMRNSCNLIDQLISEFDCESAEADVNDETLKLKISIVCPDMIFEHGRTHLFFDLIQNVESFSFSAVEDSLKADFIFAGLWEHKD